MATTDTQITPKPRTEIARARAPERQHVAPAVDVFENADEFLLVADVPGLTEDKLSIELDRGELRLEGERSYESVGKEIEAHPALDYRRSFRIPEGIDADGVSAELDDGVLFVHLPKAPSVKARKIEVHSAP